MKTGQQRGRAQAQLRAQGLDEATIGKLAPHKVFPGDRPSSTVVYRKLDPRTLGRLIAIYEHKVFAQSAIWDINAFDQWGVELGKVMASQIVPALMGTSAPTFDASTNAAVARFRSANGR